MKYKVTKDFIDRHSNKMYEVGKEDYQTDNKEWAAHLQKEGFLEADNNTTVTGESVADPKYTTVLEGTATEIIDALPGEYSKEDHEELLRLEQEGKARKTVIAHIEGLLKDESGEGNADESGKS